MLYRAATVAIVAFWLVMMALLVRLETHPDATDILDVPVSYVMRLIFKHGQQSLLAVRQEGTPIGTISLRPSITGTSGRLLECSGALSVQLPLASRQRFNFNTAIDMDPTLRVRDFKVDVTIPGPRLRLTAQGDTARNVFSYAVRQADRVTASQVLPMDAARLGPALLQNLGLPASALPVISSGISQPAVTARETRLTMHGEQLQVYEVTVTEAAAQVLDFYVTQLGQIVMATTNFGCTFSAEDYQ